MEVLTQIQAESANSTNKETLFRCYSAQLSFSSEHVPNVDCPAPFVKYIVKLTPAESGIRTK